MTTKADNILRIIKLYKGISIEELQNISQLKRNELKEAIIELSVNSLITKVQDQYYTILRSVKVFDNESEKLLAEYDIDNLDIEKTKQFISADTEDKDLAYEYEIHLSNKDYFELITNKIFDFNRCSYFLSCCYDNRKEKYSI